MATYGTSGQRRAENLAALAVTARPTPKPVDVLGIVLAVLAVAFGLPSLIQAAGLSTSWASLMQAPGDNVVLVFLGLSVSPATLSGIVAVVLGGIVASRAASGRGVRTWAVIAMAFGLATPLVAGLALGVSALT